jgi:hypothetical protein
MMTGEPSSTASVKDPNSKEEAEDLIISRPQDDSAIFAEDEDLFEPGAVHTRSVSVPSSPLSFSADDVETAYLDDGTRFIRNSQ